MDEPGIIQPHKLERKKWSLKKRLGFFAAALIVLFPIFILLSWIIHQNYEKDPFKKELAVRKWLTFLTLFITGIVIAGDLITVIYYFLDGRDFTGSFVLKALALLVITGMIFIYYIQDLRGTVFSSARKIWAGMTLLLALGAIVAGFSVIGSPQTQRLMRFDQQKVNDLQSIQWQIVNFWQAKQKLPRNLEELKDPISGQIIPIDAQSGKPYEYSVSGPLSFKLCANFNKESAVGSYSPEVSFPQPARPMVAEKGIPGMEDNWQHAVGDVCFDRTIDPDRYPPFLKQ